jgi:probable rRNA maturation factor
MIHVHINKRYANLRLASTLRQAAEAALKEQKAGPTAEISIEIAGDKKLRDLNRKYLGEDHATDVLSFPSGAKQGYLGDIAISLPRARAQAKAGGHPLTQELQLLTVHGILHLVGHDHTQPKDKQRMWAIQRKILAQLGVTVAPTE